MKMAGGLIVGFLMLLSSVPLLHGQDLSKYRSFSLGMSLADVSAYINKKPADAIALHERPALIQQLTWWPPLALGSSLRIEAIQQVRFSFYNGELYRIAVIYDIVATRGLTAEDMVHAMSLTYGTAAAAGGDFEGNAELARWEDSQYSLNLFRSSLSNSFGLVLFVKGQAAQAEAASTEAVKLEQQEAPQKELARAKKAADDLETARQKNIKTFRP
jgi:hypothetical protein